MIASELITEEIPPLKHTDTGEKALRWMEEFRVSHLPVLKGDNYVGIVSDSDIYDKDDASKTLHELFDVLPRPYVFENNHIYDIMRIVSDAKVTVIPILNEKEQYVGCTDLIHLMSKVTEISGIKEVGGIIVLEMNQIDYSLAHISQCVESNNARILSSHITASNDSTKIEVTLKINQTDLARIIATFERYDYTVKASFQKTEFYTDMQNRYDELMKYLNP
jgi:acetoin utilization protein AcuB